MTTSSATSPVTRETTSFVRDKGMRPLIVTVRGSILELRPKGLRSVEVADLATIYYSCVKARVAREKAEKKQKKRGKA